MYMIYVYIFKLLWIIIATLKQHKQYVACFVAGGNSLKVRCERQITSPFLFGWHYLSNATCLIWPH